MRALLTCVLCPRSGGDVDAETHVCRHCRQELAPTPLGLLVDVLDIGKPGGLFSVEEICHAANVSAATWHRAVGGKPIGPRSAARINALFASVSVATLRAGAPNPFAREVMIRARPTRGRPRTKAPKGRTPTQGTRR